MGRERKKFYSVLAEMITLNESKNTTSQCPGCDEKSPFRK